MVVIKCPECGITMEKIYGSKHEAYYECVECGYGKLIEKSEYDYGEYLDEDDDYEEYEVDEIDLKDSIEDDGFDY